MLGRLGPLEIGIIVLVVLLLFGATRLPQLGAAVGKTVREFRKGMQGAMEEIEPAKAESKPGSESKPGAPPTPVNHA